jgi:hypothetical protein
VADPPALRNGSILCFLINLRCNRPAARVDTEHLLSGGSRMGSELLGSGATFSARTGIPDATAASWCTLKTCRQVIFTPGAEASSGPGEA